MRRSTSSYLLLLLLLLLLCFCCSEAGETGAPMEKGEQEALFAAIGSFVGNWWNGSELYPDPCGWTPIQGVSCDLFDGLWYITVLNIGPVLENSLQCAPDAKFGAEIFDLKHLKALSLYNCFSVDRPSSIPPSGWESLSNSLETLEFRSNPGLVGPIPPLVGQLTNLRSLVMVENGLTGELPREIGNLFNLRRLVLSGNKFSGRIPTSLGQLSSLLKLDLSSNSLNGSLPFELANLKNLTLLDLRNNNLSCGSDRSLNGMVSLQDLLLSNNPFGGTLIEFTWENMLSLTTLDLSYMGLTGKIPETMTSLRGLRFLALDNNHLTGVVPRDLETLPNLSALYLNGNNFTGRLGFSAGFYDKMGRRFASWGNPNLCYDVAVTGVGKAPLGVQQCKGVQQASDGDSGLRNKVDSKNPDANANSSLLASFGLSGSKIDGFWWVLVVQEIVAAFLLVMVL
ncbi:piriformospora indica-insensitive protein 2-like isoform X2 [Ananas comosus]|uniref:Piriformospora indica-insensitive protein 2-like isoform X2 n=1 Tax=Ananas comosus TaxID=4615 RepID=A0A6P5FLH2_ANACO|nr:piriformospora indica-insensitive protein 2-like isoform X2 [Ananas comosus]